MSSKGNLKERFQNFGASPNSSAWQNISAALPSKRRKKAVIWWLVGGTGIAASIFIAINLVGLNNTQKEHLVDQKLLIEKTLKADEIKNTAPIEIDNSFQESTKNESISGLNTNMPKQKNPLKNNSDLDNQIQKETFVPKNISAVTNVPDHKNETLIAVVPGKNNLTDEQNLAIDLLAAQDIRGVKVEHENVPHLEYVAAKHKALRWQWGGKLGSDLAANTLSIDPGSTYISTTNTGVGTETSNPGASFDTPVNQPTLYSKINRPISGSFVLRFSPSAKLFFEIDPTFTFLKAKIVGNPINNWSPNAAIVNPNNSIFFSLSTGINIGYKMFSRNRWAIDVTGGINYEKLLNGWLPIGEGPINLMGNQIQLGLNYHLSEKTILRVSPEFSWVYGNSDRLLLQQFQNQKSIGIGFTLLKDF